MACAGNLPGFYDWLVGQPQPAHSPDTAHGARVSFDGSGLSGSADEPALVVYVTLET